MAMKLVRRMEDYTNRVAYEIISVEGWALWVVVVVPQAAWPKSPKLLRLASGLDRPYPQAFVSGWWE